MKQLFVKQLTGSWFALCIVFIGLSISVSSHAELNIEITQGVDSPTKIAIVPFGSQTAHDWPENLRDIVSADLQRSGLFASIETADMLSYPRTAKEVVYRDWRLLGVDYVVIGQLSEQAGVNRVDYELHDVHNQRVLFSRFVTGGNDRLRDMAHSISDVVYQTITGIRGAFNTKMLYVEALSTRNYRLMMSDVDGARARTVFASTEPLMSPAWSPDGKEVAYVSFETGRSAIFRHNLATDQREQLTNFKGINSAPAWSPDGQKMALVLSKGENTDIYVLDLATRKLTLLVGTLAIETEPSWTPDGKAIIFTSNKSGQPQIYQVGLDGGRPERLTFEGSYNARGRMTPDGKNLVMVHRYNGVFHIATQDYPLGENVRVLTTTYLDESPSVAPNGAMLIYATKYQEKGILAAVSLDAGVKFRLPSKQGDVREPAWSPYFE